MLHFAAKSLVGESKNHPAMYYQNNVGGTTNLVRAMQAADIPRLVLSSTAAIFGNPVSDLIDEEHPKAPINVYGQTKLVVEQMLQAVCESSEFSATCLRYFNAAGANNESNLGEWHEPETHLIPNALRAAAGTGNRRRYLVMTTQRAMALACATISTSMTLPAPRGRHREDGLIE